MFRSIPGFVTFRDAVYVLREGHGICSKIEYY